jgi:hypothetical protein
MVFSFAWKNKVSVVFISITDYLEAKREKPGVKVQKGEREFRMAPVR